MTTNRQHHPAAEKLGSTIEISAKRLNAEGNQLLGQLTALGRWAQMLKCHADQTLDLRERKCLLEVVDALRHDGERLKIELAENALKTNAGVTKAIQPKDAA